MNEPMFAVVFNRADYLALNRAIGTADDHPLRALELRMYAAIRSHDLPTYPRNPTHPMEREL